MLKELKVKSTAIKPIVQVGKNGLNDAMINEILKILKAKKLVKIKLTRGALDELDKKTLAAQIAEKTDSVIISLVGFNLTIYPKKFLK